MSFKWQSIVDESAHLLEESDLLVNHYEYTSQREYSYMKSKQDMYVCVGGGKLKFL